MYHSVTSVGIGPGGADASKSWLQVILLQFCMSEGTFARVNEGCLPYREAESLDNWLIEDL